MKVNVDRGKCMGLGICEATAPGTFEIDDDGSLVVLVEEVPAEQVAAVEAAVAGCPTQALSWAGDHDQSASKG
jgi:ferredoxin